MSMSIEILLREVPELRQSARQIAEEQDDEPHLGELLDALADLVINELALSHRARATPAGEEARATPAGEEARATPAGEEARATPAGEETGPQRPEEAAEPGAEEETLGRWFAAVEALAADGDEDDVAFLVGSAFLDSLGPQIRTLVEPWLGPATQAILAELDAGWPADDHLPGDDEDPAEEDPAEDDENPPPYRR
jgi:hypothetical protein